MIENLLKWRHFEKEIILLYVRWYLKYPLGYRNLIEMMVERGITVTHTAIIRWVYKYSPILDKNAITIRVFREIESIKNNI